jgi:hypothetical protein
MGAALGAVVVLAVVAGRAGRVADERDGVGVVIVGGTRRGAGTTSGTTRLLGLGVGAQRKAQGKGRENSERCAHESCEKQGASGVVEVKRHVCRIADRREPVNPWASVSQGRRTRDSHAVLAPEPYLPRPLTRR